jgi:hypothetical protein
MVDIFEERLNIDAGCSSDIPVNTNTRFQGSVDYHLVNNGDEDGAISIVVTLGDSAGHNTHFSSSLQVIVPRAISQIVTSFFGCELRDAWPNSRDDANPVCRRVQRFKVCRVRFQCYRLTQTRLQREKSDNKELIKQGRTES